MANAVNVKQSSVGKLLWPKCNCLYFGVDKTLEVSRGKKVEPYQPKLSKSVKKTILAKTGTKTNKIKRFTESGKAIKDENGKSSVVTSVNITNFLIKKLELKKQRKAEKSTKSDR